MGCTSSSAVEVLPAVSDDDDDNGNNNNNSLLNDNPMSPKSAPASNSAFRSGNRMKESDNM